MVNQISKSQSHISQTEATSSQTSGQSVDKKSTHSKRASKELFEDKLEKLIQHPHYEAELKPKTQDHLQFLLNCSAFQGNLEYGKVHANIDPRIWSWLKTIAPEVVSQCYVDAVLLSGEHSSASADSATLIKQSGIQTDLQANEMRQIAANKNKAQACLQMIHERKQQSCSPFKKHLSRSLCKQYDLTSDGGILKKDYPIYCRSLAFKDKLIAMAQQRSASKSQAELQNYLSHDRKDAANMVIALNRLQRLHQQSLS